MGWIGDTVDSIKSIQIRQLLTQAVSLGQFLTDTLYNSFFQRLNFEFIWFFKRAIVYAFYRYYFYCLVELCMKCGAWWVKPPCSDDTEKGFNFSWFQIWSFNIIKD
jgi:hypothetical protein